MSLAVLSMVVVFSNAYSVSSYAIVADAPGSAVNRLPEAAGHEAAGDLPDDNVPPPAWHAGEIRSVLRSVRRLEPKSELRPLPPPTGDCFAFETTPLPVAPPLPLPARTPAPIWPSEQFRTRPAARSAGDALGRSDESEHERRVDLQPIIQIQTAHPAQTSVGRMVRVTLTVRNAGEAAASDLRIRTALPEQAVFVASHPEPSSAEQGVLHFDLGELAADAVRKIELELVPRAAGPVELKTVASFSMAACSRIHIGRPQLSLTCQAPQRADLGDQVRYSLVVRNTGDGISEHVVVEPQVVGAAGHSASRRRFSLGDLAPGASREITLSDAARRADWLHVRFFASDRNGSEAAAEVRVQVLRPAVEVTLAGPGEITLGGEALFEIRAVNTGAGAVEPVRVACSVGDGLRLTVLDQQVQFATKPGQLTWAIGRLAGGDTKVLRFRACPVTAGEQQIRVAVESAGSETGKMPRPTVEKTVTIRDRTIDERTASR